MSIFVPMIRLQTPVADLPCRTGISYSDRILMLGSCFTDSIGERLGNYGFDVCVNPFGTLYNPLSILSSIERLAEGKLFVEEDVVQMGAGSELFCSFSHHTSFARPSADGFLECANAALLEASDFWARCTKVIVTLGTAWCYFHAGHGRVVSNCLKRNAAEFDRRLCTVGETAAALKRMAELCHGRDIIFTVSPIRHFRDGAHGNQISKSVLLLGVDEVCSGAGEADYFPAYEIMNDELRDYRFYAEDMCHPSGQAEDYICERFLDWALPESEHASLRDNMRAYRRSCHRPIH